MCPNLTPKPMNGDTSDSLEDRARDLYRAYRYAEAKTGAVAEGTSIIFNLVQPHCQ